MSKEVEGNLMDPAVSRETDRLARFIREYRFDDFPGPVIETAKALVLDTLGSMLAASSSRYSIGGIISEFARNQGGAEESTLIGSRGKASAVNAALANGTLGYFCDIEAHHPEAILHGAAVVVPTALATGERQRASGREFVSAVILGIETGVRSSLAIGPTAMYRRGFHPSAVAGAIGASAAAGRMLGLESEGLRRAFGLAGTQSSGLLAWETDSLEHARPFNPGIAARNGTTAAILAEMGMGGPPDIFFGKFNLFGAYSDGDERPEELTRSLGEGFEITQFAFKQYSCCAFLHPGLDALLEIVNEHDLKSDDVASIVLRFPTSGVQLIDDNPLKSHCGQYILPIAVLDRQIRVDDIVNDRRSDPKVSELVRRTEVLADDELDNAFPERYSSIVEVTTVDGRAFSSRVDHAYGTAQNPFDRRVIEDKFRRLAREVVDDKTATSIIETVNSLDELGEIGELGALCSYSA